MTRPITGICLVLLLSACGGGGGIGGTVTPIEGVSYRYVRNSVDKQTVVAFLEDIQYGYPIIRHRSAPTLRMAPDSTSRERRQVANAVRFVNSALPEEFRIRIGSDAPDRQDGVPDGEIWIDFAHLDEWPVDRGSATAHAQYQQYSSDPDNPAFAVHIWLDKTKTDAREDGWNTAFLVHEILHAMGLDGHVNRDRFDSIMSPYIDHPLARPTQPPDLLFPIDKDGIAAVYMLNIGDDPSDLGDWNRYIREFQGTVGPVTFGVDAYNWGLEPWVQGIWSTGDIRQIQGEASWKGILVGFTPSVQAVLGSVDMSVDLESLAGTLDFEDLEHWSEGRKPGKVGSGTTWGDGDLSYNIQVAGSKFTNTEGDTGFIDGGFFGPHFQGAAGVLLRDDLTASFGASR